VKTVYARQDLARYLPFEEHSDSDGKVPSLPFRASSVATETNSEISEFSAIHACHSRRRVVCGTDSRQGEFQ
jgi:hypothetical protein